MATMTGPIESEDVIADDVSVSLRREKFAALLDYVEHLEHTLKFTEFELEREHAFVDVLAVSLSESTRVIEVLESILQRYDIHESQKVFYNWKEHLRILGYLADSQVSLGTLSGEQRDKLASILFARFGQAKEESGSAAG